MRFGIDWCHPTHAQRTKCACGLVMDLGGAVGAVARQCKCGRVHSKAPGSAFQKGNHVGHHGGLSTGKRAGGRKGCPGLPR